MNEKHFIVTDKTGRSSKPYRLTGSYLKEYWDLTDEDWVNDVSLGDFIEDCELDDVWENDTVEITLERIETKN